MVAWQPRWFEGYAFPVWAPWYPDAALAGGTGWEPLPARKSRRTRKPTTTRRS